jgi:hypothetical protein
MAAPFPFRHYVILLHHKWSWRKFRFVWIEEEYTLL